MLLIGLSFVNNVASVDHRQQFLASERMMMSGEQKFVFVLQRLFGSVRRICVLSSGFQVAMQVCGRDGLQFEIEGLFESGLFGRK